MAPERLSGSMKDMSEIDMRKADIWSVGVILFLIVFGKPPFEGALTSNLVKSIKKAQINLKDNKWNENLKKFVQLVKEMIDPDPSSRIEILAALNHGFFLKEMEELEKLTFKRTSLQYLEEFWNLVTLKNEVKNFGQFMASCYHPSSLIERIFEAKVATNLKQVINGISYITEDLTLARFIIEAGFPEGFND